MTATTEQVLQRHLKAIGERDLAAALADYTEASLFFTPNGVLRGPGEMTPLMEAFFAEFARPGASFELKTQLVEGETAFIVWQAETADNIYELGTDTYVIRDGKIVTQTFAAKVVPKS